MAARVFRILLVEDDPTDVDFIVRELHRTAAPCVVAVARDGEEALDFLFRRVSGNGTAFEGAPHVVILDLKLPKVDGLEVLREIKSFPATQVIPVVTLTSSTEESDLEESYRLGVNSYIQKPIDYQAFKNTICAIKDYWILNQVSP